MNGKIKNMEVSVLSDDWATLQKVKFEYLNKDKNWEKQTREVYDRGNGAAVLLYNLERQTVVLTEQFRMATYLNKNENGMMIEACAGMLDENDPETAIKKEIEEETGYHLDKVKKLFECYMSPGAVTEILHFFIAPYSEKEKLSEGGGAKEETENIRVLEYSFTEALEMIKNGKIKDAKTIILLQYAQINLFNSPK